MLGKLGLKKKKKKELTTVVGNYMINKYSQFFLKERWR